MLFQIYNDNSAKELNWRSQVFSATDKQTGDTLGIVFPFDPTSNINNRIICSSIIDANEDTFRLKHTEVRIATTKKINEVNNIRYDLIDNTKALVAVDMQETSTARKLLNKEVIAYGENISDLTQLISTELLLKIPSIIEPEYEIDSTNLTKKISLSSNIITPFNQYTEPFLFKINENNDLTRDYTEQLYQLPLASFEQFRTNKLLKKKHFHKDSLKLIENVQKLENMSYLKAVNLLRKQAKQMDEDLIKYLGLNSYRIQFDEDKDDDDI